VDEGKEGECVSDPLPSREAVFPLVLELATSCTGQVAEAARTLNAKTTIEHRAISRIVT
jgi:hypothetical protein